MIIPKIHAFGAEDADKIYATAHKKILDLRKTVEGVPEDGVPTEEQMEEIKFVVESLLLKEYRPAIEEQIAPFIDTYVVIDGEPATDAEKSAFWSDILPTCVGPFMDEVARLQGGSTVFEVSKYSPWTPAGRHDMCVELARKLRTAQIDSLAFDDDFLRITELDPSRISLIGTVEWNGDAEGLDLPPRAPGDLVDDYGPDPLAGPPPSLEGNAKAARNAGRPKGSQKIKVEPEVVVSLWVAFHRATDFEVTKFCHAVGISPASLRNYSAGKSKGTINDRMIASMKTDLAARQKAIDECNRLLKLIRE